MKHQHARFRFRAAVRMVILNRFWLTDVGKEVDISNVQQNVQRLTHRKKDYKELLTLEERSILNKPAENRTIEEKQRIGKIMSALNCFNRYPQEVKAKLGGVCYFCYYPAGRTIVRQTHPSECLYFILTGSVGVIKTSYDELDEKYYDTQVGVLDEGNMFGEVALLHDIPRQATIVTLTDCEFLKMYKDDFNSVMKATLKRKWDDIQAGMTMFDYFRAWNPIQVRECCIISKIQEYKTGAVVLTTDRPNNFVYFILSGQADVVEELCTYEWTNDVGETCFALGARQAADYSIRLPEKSYNVSTQEVVVKRGCLDNTFSQFNTSKRNRRASWNDGDHPVEAAECTRAMRVCTFNVKACFGFGELSPGRTVIATQPTRCLVIPRYFLFKQTDLEEWTKVRRYLINQIPNTETVFQQFVLARRWRKFKESLVRSVVKKPPANTMTNVPYSIRLKEYYFDA